MDRAIRKLGKVEAQHRFGYVKALQINLNDLSLNRNLLDIRSNIKHGSTRDQVQFVRGSNKVNLPGLDLRS